MAPTLPKLTIKEIKNESNTQAINSITFPLPGVYSGILGRRSQTHNGTKIDVGNNSKYGTSSKYNPSEKDNSIFKRLEKCSEELSKNKKELRKDKKKAKGKAARKKIQDKIDKVTK
jgi:hypothetical protein